MDSKEPDWSKFQDFLKGEVRYTSLMKSFPAEAETLDKVARRKCKNGVTILTNATQNKNTKILIDYKIRTAPKFRGGFFCYSELDSESFFVILE